MKNPHIHPTAIVETSDVHPSVVIEPYAIVKKNVVLEKDVVIKSHAYIDGYTTIGEGTVIWPSASIGTKTQDKKYSGEKTYVRIGKKCEIREFVTINSSTQADSVVQVGDNCLIMAYCHIAHNCIVGNNVIMSNNATLAGHVIVEDFVNLGGFTPVHQFVRIGAHSMVGGMSRVNLDVPPFTIGAGSPYRFGGINIVGLKRRGFSRDKRNALARAFKFVYRSGLRLEEALHLIETTLPQIPEIQHWLAFCRATQRGLIGLQGVRMSCSSHSASSSENHCQKNIIPLV